MKIFVTGHQGYIGAHLARGGADVVLFARGPHLQAMQADGLRVISPDGDFAVRPAVRRDDARGALQLGDDHEVLRVLHDLDRQDVQHAGREAGRQAHRTRLVVARVAVSRLVEKAFRAGLHGRHLVGVEDEVAARALRVHGRRRRVEAGEVGLAVGGLGRGPEHGLAD